MDNVGIVVEDIDAAVEFFTELGLLSRLGATVVDRQWVDHPGSWIIMRDPAGMEFCVVWAMNPIRPQEVRDDFERRAKWVE